MKDRDSFLTNTRTKMEKASASYKIQLQQLTQQSLDSESNTSKWKKLSAIFKNMKAKLYPSQGAITGVEEQILSALGS